MKTMLTPEDLAERWSMAVGTLENWRRQGIGPNYVKLSGKKIIYRIKAVEDFEKANEVKK